MSVEAGPGIEQFRPRNQVFLFKDDPTVAGFFIDAITQTFNNKISVFTTPILDDFMQKLRDPLTDPSMVIVVTDMIIRGSRDGLELVRQMKHNDRLATVPILVATADPDRQARSECLSLGVSEKDYIQLPLADLAIFSKRLARLSGQEM